MAKPSRSGVAWLLLAMSGLSLAFAWVLASPVGASPDEPAHIWYAWGTVTGQTVGNVKLGLVVDQRATVIQVPQSLLQHMDPICYMRQPGLPLISCKPTPPDNGQLVTRLSYMSRYPPLFYGVEGAVLRAGTAAHLSGFRVLYGARLAAAILSFLTVVFGVSLLSRRFPPPFVMLATLLGLPATAWFLASSVNPNGLEIAAAFLLAAGVLSLRVDHFVGVRSVAAILAVPIGTLLLVWTRPISWVWASLILGMLLIPTGPRKSGAWRRQLPVRRLGATATVATVLVLTAGMAWFAYSLQVRTLAQPPVNPTPWAAVGTVAHIVLLLLSTGSVITDQIGNFGWQDTPLPTLAVLAWVSMTGVAVAVWSVGRKTIVPRWSLGAVLGLGYLAALVDEYRGAWAWQGRYLLPLTAAVCVFAIPGLVKGFGRWTTSARVVPWMLVLLMGVNALSVVWFLFRNAYGVRDFTLRRLPAVPFPVGTPSWTPPLGLGVVLGLAMLALACGVAAVWALRPVPTNMERPVPTNVERPVPTNVERPVPTNVERPVPAQAERQPLP